MNRLSMDMTALIDEDESHRTRRGDKSAIITRSAYEVARARKQDRHWKLKLGLWPGFCASIQDRERPGQWIAVVLLNTAPHQYRRRESFARFDSSEDAYAAAESWLRREIAKRENQ